MAFSALIAAADRTALQHLGDAVRYTTSAGLVVDVRGIFDAAHVKADAGQAGVSTVGPAVFLSLSGLPSDPSVDEPTITVSGTVYGVREAQPDGHGGILLQLQRA